MSNPGCGLAGLPGVPAQSAPVVIDSTSIGGTYVGSSGSVPAGAIVNLLEDLTIVVENDLIIEGAIVSQPHTSRGAQLLRILLGQLPSQTPVAKLLSQILNPGPLNVTLVSLKGKVQIAPSGHIDLGFTPKGDNDFQQSLSARAVGGDADDGGYIKIQGVNVDIQGNVRGQGSGDGGNATADAAGASGLPAKLLKLFGIGGDAEATGGNGGAGGDVLLCADESIHISGVVGAGYGGLGGVARAIADVGGPATAIAGQGKNGGNVQITGTGPASVQVFAKGGSMQGGDCDDYPNLLSAEAVGGSGFEAGGRAKAEGSLGGSGGTVLFSNAVVIELGSCQAGDGAAGGDASATGGNGTGIRMLNWGSAVQGDGYNGGPATATGGSSGAAGPLPLIPVPPIGTTQKGKAGYGNQGGDASAVGGAGSDGLPLRLGGSSGRATAQGGSNGAGVSPGPPALGILTPPTASTGAPAVSVSQLGKP